MRDSAHSDVPAPDLPDFPVPSHDPRSVSDALRPDTAVALSTTGSVVLLRHADVVAAARDDATFSSAVSSHLQVPNGLDGEEHTAFRALIEPYFTSERMDRLEPVIREVARDLCAELGGAASGEDSDGRPGEGPEGRVHVDAVADLGARFAVRAQTRWLGWPAELEAVLLRWMADNQAATRSGDRTRTAEVADRFDAIIRSVLEPRRAADRGNAGRRSPGPGVEPSAAPADVTEELMRDTTLGRALREEELVSILRNWTGGDLGSIALCVGVIAHSLAGHPAVQQRLRSGLPRAETAAIVDEILRIDNPFVANRRVTTCPVTAGGVRLPAGQRVVLNWTSANRDRTVFGDPDVLDPEAHAAHNLVYGTGRHVCPGRPLATMELCVLVEELVAAFSAITPGARTPERNVTPTGGFAVVPVELVPTRA